MSRNIAAPKHQLLQLTRWAVRPSYADARYIFVWHGSYFFGFSVVIRFWKCENSQLNGEESPWQPSTSFSVAIFPKNGCAFCIASDAAAKTVVGLLLFAHRHKKCEERMMERKGIQHEDILRNGAKTLNWLSIFSIGWVRTKGPQWIRVLLSLGLLDCKM